MFSKTLIAVALTMVAFSSNAAIIKASASLDYFQEVNPSNLNPSDATGEAALVFDTDTGLLDLNATIDGIFLADITFASGGLAFGNSGPFHIHDAAAGSNGPIVVPFNAASFFTETVSGLSINVTDVPFNVGLIAELIAGSLYLNLHTLDYVSGEIRGQIRVPEPGAILLVGGGLVLVSMRWRRLR